MLRYLNYDFDDVKLHFDEFPPEVGDTLILAMPQHHMNRFRLVKVEKTNHGRQRRIIVTDPCCFAGASYYRTGKSCFAPKGQTRLLPYVESVAKLIEEGKDTILVDEQIAQALGKQGD